MNISEEKNELRARFKKIRAGLDVRSKSLEICRRCVALSELSEARIVLLYAPKGDEADIISLFEHCRGMGKTVGFPRCTDSENMEFFRVGSLEELKVGRFGIREPVPDAELIKKEEMGVDCLCFVPALAFDAEGYRLGYGAGYYDRFLSDFRGTCIGVTFEDCLVPRLPRGEHDIKADHIITESRVKKGIED